MRDHTSRPSENTRAKPPSSYRSSQEPSDSSLTAGYRSVESKISAYTRGGEQIACQWDEGLVRRAGSVVVCCSYGGFPRVRGRAGRGLASKSRIGSVQIYELRTRKSSGSSHGMVPRPFGALWELARQKAALAPPPVRAWDRPGLGPELGDEVAIGYRHDVAFELEAGRAHRHLDVAPGHCDGDFAGGQAKSKGYAGGGERT